MDELASEFDTAWKQALTWFFESFLAFYFPKVQAEVDWAHKPEFLDKELQKIAPEAKVGGGTVDLLVKVKRLDGTTTHLLVHVEVQSQYDPNFPKRMYTYNHRLTDRYGQMPVSMAILGDAIESWRPDTYEEDNLGCKLTFEFHSRKLLEYRKQAEGLRVDSNPFAAVTLAHLSALETKGAPELRYSQKMALVKGLYQRGFTHERVYQLFRLIDWILKLPRHYSQQFKQEIEMFDKENETPLLSPTEELWREDALQKGIQIGEQKGIQIGEQKGRQEGIQIGEQKGIQIGEQKGIQIGEQKGIQIGEQKGRQEALLEGIDVALALRFGNEGSALMSRVRTITDVSVLAAFLSAIKSVPDLDALRAMLPS